MGDMVMEATVITGMVLVINNNPTDMVRIINNHRTISQSLMPNLRLILNHKLILKHIINNQLRNTAILILKVVIAMAAIHNSILKLTLRIKSLLHRTDYSYRNIVKMYLS